MKGVIIERALPSNVLDIYALMKGAVKEKAYNHQNPSEAELKNYYFILLNELAHPSNVIYLARRGRQYLGFIQSKLVLSPWGSQHSAFISMLYVVPKKRKLGIAKKLTDRFKADITAMGIPYAELMCNDEMASYWQKQGAKKALNLMILGAK